METSYWESANDWEEDPETKLLYKQHTKSYEGSGSYHCKSALRDHNSNMKLFLYKKSFLKLRQMTSADPYTEDVCLIIPDLWRCFYKRSHGLNRIEDIRAAEDHSRPSPSVDKWSSHVRSTMEDHTIVHKVLLQEKSIWKSRMEWLEDFGSRIYTPSIRDLDRLIALVCLLNASLVILNFTPVEERPSIRATLPGICDEVGDGIYTITYNEYFKITICGQAVRVAMPSFDQILQKDIFLNICDKLNERMNVILGASIIQNISSARKTGDMDECTMLTLVNRVLDWGDSLLHKERNRAYDLIAKYEAYCVSAILLYDDNDVWDCEEFQMNLLQDDRDNSPDLYPHARELCRIINGMSPVGLAEIHGLWRIWGHPIIDLEGGLQKMERTCLKRHNIDRKETITGERTFKFLFATNYYNKHRHYPLSNITPKDQADLYTEHMSARDRDEHNALYREEVSRNYILERLRNNKPINNRHAGYKHEDWDNVVFLQSFQTPHSINLATMIKDKAISQTRSELASSILTRNSVFDATKRRGVLKWLSEQTMKLKNYLMKVDEVGILEDDRIIGLYPKERELKTKARFFSLMSYNMRMYITATEELLGKYLLPYFPMITMSDTLLSMIIRLFNMTTSIGATESSVTYSMNIDFSKWNQNMREQTNSNIFQCIDRNVGFRNLISRTHDIFRRSYLYLCSGEYIPTLIRGQLTARSPYSRIGDESGKEGLRQKGWTITTVCDIVSLAFIHGVQIELIGGGDNQVLTVTIRSSKRNLSLPESKQRRIIRERMERFRNALAKKMDKRGLPLKREETWISHRLLMYNKIMYHDGVPLPGRLKVTSTLGTGYQALSSKDYDPVITWIVSRIFTLLNICQYHLFCPMAGLSRIDQLMLSCQRNMKNGIGAFGAQKTGKTAAYMKEIVDFSTHKCLDKIDLFLVCLYFHKVLGGPGIGSPLSYIMKGFPDPLSEALTFNYMVLEGGQHISQHTKQKVENLTRVNGSKIKHWEHLLEDPVSVNHDAPSHGVAALREQASRVMKNAKIENRQFKEMIQLGDKEYLQDLSANLCSSDDVEPRLLHDIVGSTLPGYVNTILSKVDQSSTLNKLSITGGIINNIYESEINYYIYLAKKITVGTGHIRSPCPTTDAAILRTTTWGKNIIGVTTPHPAAYLTPALHGGSDPGCDHNYISVLVKRSYKISDLRRGDFRPYFGSYTKEKFKGSILTSAYGDEDILRRALKIQKLLGWRYTQGTYMYSVIQGILSCVTDADPNKFLPTVEEITGDVEHRYHDMATKHGGIPSNLIKHYTHASCNTTTFRNHSKGAANESLHFQAAMIYCSMVGIMAEANHDRTSRVYHFHETCAHCIKPIVHADDITRLDKDVSLVSCEANDLMFVREEEIPVHFHNVVSFHEEQEKRASELDNRGGIALTEFVEPKERKSWVLLAISTLIHHKGTKESAVDLIIEKLSDKELIVALMSHIYYHRLQKGMPVLGYDLCDVQDILVMDGNILRRILRSPKIRSVIFDEGIIEEGKDDDDATMMMSLVADKHDMMETLLRGAVCKYQDPYFKVGKALLCIAKAPSLKTCIQCANAIQSSIWRKEKEKTCAIHQIRPPELSYHMYSLDKLYRYAGPPTDQTTSKRKRAGGLFSYIKRARDHESSIMARTRLSGFLFRNLPFEDDISTYLCGGWSKISVSTTKHQEPDRVDRQNAVIQEPPSEPVLPPLEGKVLSLAQMLIASLSLSSNPSSTIQAAVEVDVSLIPSQVYIKALKIVADTLRKIGDVKVHFSLMLGQVKDLERTDIDLLSEICSRVGQHLAPGGHMTMIDDREGSLDISIMMDLSDITILLNPELLCYSQCGKPVFLITDSLNSFDIAARAEAALMSQNIMGNVSVMQPMVSSSWPSPTIIHIGNMRPQEKTVSGLVSEEKLLHVLDNYIPEVDTSITNMIIESSWMGGRVSLVHALYKRYVTMKVGILQKSHYERVKTCLSGGLYEFALKSAQDDVMDWKCILIIKLLIVLRIATAEDEKEALSEYCRVVGVSFKRGTYRRILLHTKRPKKQHRKRLVNWTKGAFNYDLPIILSEIREWITIDWREEHKFSGCIDI
ncbi:TPA_asm: L [Plectranthus aromaticus virus 1]|uniref:RNA-directed RNA polymerase n=1 Tax=Plectranthus aromaticus virus 1 TaxID=2793738 RepID=A0A8D9PH07_9RHAB|nr:L [Plectranthus aromaticus virus 1] [Plectranthus aromaticus virus 1]DAF42302.1 TPA_asm: L [Plectranthus aromaticus virus 1]